MCLGSNVPLFWVLRWGFGGSRLSGHGPMIGGGHWPLKGVAVVGFSVDSLLDRLVRRRVVVDPPHRNGIHPVSGETLEPAVVELVERIAEYLPESDASALVSQARQARIVDEVPGRTVDAPRNYEGDDPCQDHL